MNENEVNEVNENVKCNENEYPFFLFLNLK